ncbi:MAG: bifunctional serine/threonine-protein kinase/formylglycine-generating enzyme family protein, partial [Planctomycetes bacterium]|nr:bifunctional serine/threonine-protein kinase/formylglycine-generating enzyme family protein [Planctomycetota bacterium]
MAEAGDPTSRQEAEDLFTAHIAELDEGGEERLEELCEEHPAHAESLRELYAEWRSVDDLFQKVIPDRGTITADLAPLLGSIVAGRGEGSSAESSSSQAALEAIRERLASEGRYDVQDEFARGGMGAILKVFDRNIRRDMAMKVMLDRGLPGDSKESALNTRALGRFLDEAQITGQLEHPGIVPVHELGVDEDGQVYFTMKLVQGEELGDKYDKVFTGDEEWNTTRVLGVLLRVCEAMAFAHSKGVIHRDLKPANVMVGEFGEVYVMDWGLARILGREDFHGEELTPSTSDAQVVSDRLEQRDISPGSTMFTMEGDVMGTPTYMPPEQARGEIEEMDERSDVYAIGAMIYHLLSGRRPYQADGEGPNAFTTLMRLLDGPPKRLHEFGLELAPELEAICEKAMSRERDARYADMRELADDLRSYLEGRVVAAYQTGALAELKMWVRRNRSLANSLVAGVLVLVAGVVTSTYYWNESAEQAVRAEEQAEKAELETAKVLRLGDARDLQTLWDDAKVLWPAHPSRVKEMQAWLSRAEELLSRLPEHREVLRDLGESALPRTSEEEESDRANHPLASDLANYQGAIEKIDAGIRAYEEAGDEETADFWRAKREDYLPVLRELEEKVGQRITFRFEDSQKEWWHGALTNLIRGLEFVERDDIWLEDEEFGYQSSLKEMTRRLEAAEEVDALSISGAENEVRWRAAIQSIADEAECPMYAGLSISPQRGLLPIGRDPRSGLWEFACVQSGEAPERGEDGALLITEESAIVLVLLPSGSFWMGAQSEEEGGRNYDPEASPKERPVHEVELEPYLLSKYEVSQAQWRRITYTNESRYKGSNKTVIQDAETEEVLCTFSTLHPVEYVSWLESSYGLSTVDLTLPTEAQWEFAARAGTVTPWWTGTEAASLQGKENLCDQSAISVGEPGWNYEAWNDGFPAHAPISSFTPNPWGFHHILG